MKANSNPDSLKRQANISQTKNKMESAQFYNLLRDQDLVEIIQKHVPEYRERIYTPANTVAMFLDQVMSSDKSCQKSVDQA